MNRVRVIVKEISIRQKGEVHFFQIRLPRNATRIRGIEYDAFLISPLSAGPPPESTVSLPNRMPFLKWKLANNPILGKLKLQSPDRNNLFFGTWLSFQHYQSGIPDMSFGLFPKSPYTLNRSTWPKRLDQACSIHVINGMFEDQIGLRQDIDLEYRIKVFVWIETTEEAKGVQYDFQETPGSDELQLKM